MSEPNEHFSLADSSDSARAELRDRIAVVLLARSSESLTGSDWLNPRQTDALADAVMELFPVIEVWESPGKGTQRIEACTEWEVGSACP